MVQREPILTRVRRWCGMSGALVRLVWQASPYLFITLLTLTLIASLCPPAGLLVTARLIDLLVRTLTEPNVAALPSALLWWLAAFAGVGILEQTVSRLRINVERLYQMRVRNHIQLLIAEKAASLDLAFFENPTFHDMLRNAASDATYRPLMIVTGLLNAIAQLITIGSLATILLLWQPWVVPVSIVAALGLFWMSLRFGTSQVNLTLGQTPENRRAQYLSMLLTSDHAAKEVRLFNLQPFFLRQMGEILERVYRRDRKLLTRQTLFAAFCEPIFVGVRPALVAFAVVEAFYRRITLGQLTLYMQALIQLHATLLSLIGTLAQLHEHQLFVAQLFKFMEITPTIEARQHRAPRTPSRQPRIEFQHVSFRYPDSESDVIHDVSFVIQPGETVALVGDNGAGKTTIVKLLAGLYEPTEGQILLDGIDIRLLDRATLRGMLSVIFQDYPIYHSPIYDNIAVGDVTVYEQRERIEAAARQSGLSEVVARLPQGYETLLGRWFERGHELSGGQRQLVALTRALLREAPLLILDEPSAALDIHAERHFFHHLLDTVQDRTQSVLFISHRFSTVRRAHRIIVLDRGQLVEQGSHEQLMALNGRYADLFTLQAASYLEHAQLTAEDELHIHGAAA